MYLVARGRLFHGQVRPQCVVRSQRREKHRRVRTGAVLTARENRAVASTLLRLRVEATRTASSDGLRCNPARANNTCQAATTDIPFMT